MNRRRYSCKADANARELDQVATELGASVARLDAVGAGLPDRVLGYRGQNVLVEYKNPTNTRGVRGLNYKQRRFSLLWRGAPPRKVQNREELVALLRELDLVADQRDTIAAP